MYFTDLCCLCVRACKHFPALMLRPIRTWTSCAPSKNTSTRNLHGLCPGYLRCRVSITDSGFGLTSFTNPRPRFWVGQSVGRDSGSTTSDTARLLGNNRDDVPGYVRRASTDATDNGFHASPRCAGAEHHCTVHIAPHRVERRAIDASRPVQQSAPPARPPSLPAR